MVRVVDCHAGVLGSNPGGPKIFSPWNYFTGGSGNSVTPGAASERVYTPLYVSRDGYARLSKKGKSAVTVPFLTASLLG